MTDEKFMTLKDIMDFFGASRYTIYRWIREGKFPVGKLTPGGRIWSASRLTRWLSEEDDVASVFKSPARKARRDIENAPGKRLTESADE